MHYVKDITEKWKKGQPVSLTDFYGHCVGESLLGPVSLASNFCKTSISSRVSTIRNMSIYRAYWNIKNTRKTSMF